MAEPGISLDELADLVSTLPGRMLFCALDCCFSGSLGAHVFATGLRSRSAAGGSSVAALNRFTGDGRVVLTAAADDQPALESVRHGHGLLTFRLMEALQVAPEVSQGDQVNPYQVIEYVTRHVEADAAQMGCLQSLAAFGLPAAVMDAWAGSITGLNGLQLSAINDFGGARWGVPGGHGAD